MLHSNRKRKHQNQDQAAFNNAHPDPQLEVDLDGAGFKDITDFSPSLQVGLEGNAIEEIMAVRPLRKDGCEALVALWMKGNPDRLDVNSGARLAVELPTKSTQVIGIDRLKGVEQELSLEQKNGTTRINGLVGYDYPLVLRIKR